MGISVFSVKMLMTKEPKEQNKDLSEMKECVYMLTVLCYEDPAQVDEVPSCDGRCIVL